MVNLFSKIEELRDGNVRFEVDNRLLQLKKNSETKDSIFSELSFCMMTANFQAKKCIDIQNKYRKEILSADEDELKKILKDEGHRFWEQRAQRIVLAREKRDELINKLKDKDIRDWIVKNFSGIGMKEASHFLRNIGNFNYAIIDFHIIDLLVNEDIIQRPKTITPKKYLEIEGKLKEIAERYNMSLGELDFYLWYLETGKILK